MEYMANKTLIDENVNKAKVKVDYSKIVNSIEGFKKLAIELGVYKERV